MHYSQITPQTTTDHSSTTGRMSRLIAGAGLAHAAMITNRFGRSRRSDRLEASSDADLGSVLIVDDPDGTMRLIGVSGIAGTKVIDDIRLAMPADDYVRTVHVDLSAVTKWTLEALTQLEGLFDDIECSGLRLRVVGLDPRLPALVA